MENPYKVLEVENNADLSVCKKAYRRLCIKYHPDSASGDADKFRVINNAWDMINNGYRVSESTHSTVFRSNKVWLEHINLFNFRVRRL